MADATCRSCGRTVPAGAATCPHCGVEAPVATGAAGGAMDGPAAGPAAGPAPGPAVGPAPDTPAATGAGAETRPVPERRTSPGSRVSKALKALGCLVLALIVLGIAVVVGVFDLIL